MHLNKLKKNYGSTGKINTNTIGGLDLAEVERADVGSPSFGSEDSWRANDESPFPSKPALLVLPHAALPKECHLSPPPSHDRAHCL